MGERRSGRDAELRESFLEHEVCHLLRNKEVVVHKQHVTTVAVGGSEVGQGGNRATSRPGRLWKAKQQVADAELRLQQQRSKRGKRRKGEGSHVGIEDDGALFSEELEMEVRSKSGFVSGSTHHRTKQHEFM